MTALIVAAIFLGLFHAFALGFCMGKEYADEEKLNRGKAIGRYDLIQEQRALGRHRSYRAHYQAGKSPEGRRLLHSADAGDCPQAGRSQEWERSEQKASPRQKQPTGLRVVCEASPRPIPSGHMNYTFTSYGELGPRF
jgi:hypothetical protein